MKSVAFVADSSGKIGTGHIMRCLTLAKQFRLLDFEIVFFSREVEGNINSLIESFGYKVVSFPSDFSWNKNANKVISELRGKAKGCDIVIIDHYEIDFDFEEQLKLSGFKIVAIDDLANRKHDCDVLIDQNYYHGFETRYSHLVPKECIQFLGPNAILLRDEFKANRNKATIRDGKINGILVFYGGSDPSNETEKALQAIRKSKYSGKVNVIVGQSNPKKEKIKELCDENVKWEYSCQVKNISDYMVNADLSFGAGGSAAWERVYLGLPTVVTIIADNQKMLTEHASELGILINLGTEDKVTVELLTKALEQVARNPKLLYEISKKSRSFFGNVKSEKTLAEMILEGIRNDK